MARTLRWKICPPHGYQLVGPVLHCLSQRKKWCRRRHIICLQVHGETEMSEKLTVEFWDKMLPNQHEHTYHYSGDNYAQALFDVIAQSSGIPNPHESFTLEHTEMFTVEEMASNPVSMRFFEFLIAVAGVKRVLEIGALLVFRQ